MSGRRLNAKRFLEGLDVPAERTTIPCGSFVPRRTLMMAVNPKAALNEEQREVVKTVLYRLKGETEKNIVEVFSLAAYINTCK